MHKSLSTWALLLVASSLPGQNHPATKSTPPATLLELSGPQLEAPVLLNPNTIGVLKLPSNPSSGYRWEVLHPEEVTPFLDMHQARDHRGRPRPEFAHPTAGPLSPGAQHDQLIRLTGRKKGQARLTLVYRRPWEAGYKDRKVITIESAGAYQGPMPQAAMSAPYVPPPPSTVAAGALPSRWDWREHNGVTPVKDQGQCGSCWTFGTTAAMESKVLIKTGVVRDYAEEYLVRCANLAGQGCNGGWWGYDYYWKIAPVGEIGAGARLESEMPYTESDGPCGSPHTPYEQLEGWAYTDGVADKAWPTIDHKPTVAQVKQALYDYGPLGTGVDSSSWGGYTGGVWTNVSNGICNHIVTIVGWDDADGAFIIKNSWGANWGENGYMRLAYGADLVGDFSTYVLRENTAPAIMLRTSGMREGKANDGGFDAPLHLYVANATAATNFSRSSGDFTLGTHYTVSGLPAGLTAKVTATSATTATLSLLGKATSHLAANSVSGVSLTFLGAAFSGGNAGAVSNATSSIGVTFHDPYKFIYTKLATPIVVNTGNPWDMEWMTDSDSGFGYGIWWTGINSAYPEDPNQNSLKLEIYGNQALCTGNVMPGQLIPLSAGSVIGPSAQTWCNCGTYGDQVTITRNDYMAWAGRTAYAGFTFINQGYPVYGWFKIQVDPSGTSATLSELAWDQNPNNTIKAGQTVGETIVTPSVTVTSPSAGAQWAQGSSNTITWTASNFTNAKVELLKGGAVASTLAASVPAANGTFTWTVPATQTLGTDYAVRVSCIDPGKTATSTSPAFSVVTNASAPAIVQHPANQTVSLGKTATFSVAATGSAPLRYQWQKNNANIAGATAATYTTPATVAGDNNATFRCVVTNSVGSATSNAATLTVTTGNVVTATITTPASDVTVASGTAVAFRGSATNSSSTATMTYAWNFGDGGTATGTSASRTFTNTGTAPVTRAVTFTAKDNTNASGTATRLVTVNPATQTLGINLQVVPGQGSATFNPNATGATSVTYWLDNQTPVTKTTAPFTHTATGLASGAHSVYARASNAAGASVDSGWVTFTIQGLSLNLQVTVSGRTATFNPNATGAKSVTYWVDSRAAVSKTTAPFTHSLSNLTVGTHSVYARAYDANGGYQDSGWVNFTIK